jgi:hypothetical protein
MIHRRRLPDTERLILAYNRTCLGGDDLQKLDDVTRTQLAENLRFLADIYNKQLTVFLAVLALGAAGIAQYGNDVIVGSVTVRLALAVIGMAFTAFMWLVEVRAMLTFEANRKLVPELWPLPATPGFTWLNATIALALLNMVFYGSLWWCAFKWDLYWILLLMLALLGTCMVVFTVVSYYPLRHYDKETWSKTGREH